MGYQTDFDGAFKLDRQLEPGHENFLQRFSETRRMARDARRTAERPDPVRENVGLPVGIQGAYFVGDGDTHGPDVTDHNEAPKGQPGLWCQWVPTPEGDGIVWDGNEKFYEYTEWLAYLIEHFLEPWGYKLSGVVEWSGEEVSDAGRIYVKDNMVQAIRAETTYAEPDWD